MDPTSAIITPSDWMQPLALDTYFPRSQPLELDIGCGKGRFLVARARQYPATNFLGIERLLRRLRKVDRRIRREALPNVRLIRIEAFYAIKYLLKPGTVSTCYIFFPDPWPKRRHHDRRLVTAPFIHVLSTLLHPGGCVHLATDHLGYHAEMVALFGANRDFEPIDPFIPTEEEKTDYEVMMGGARIGRCSFRRKT